MGSKAVLVEAVERVQINNGGAEEKKEECDRTSDNIDSNHSHLKKNECELDGKNILVKIEDFISDEHPKVPTTNADECESADPPNNDDDDKTSNDTNERNIYVDKNKPFSGAGKMEQIYEIKTNNARSGVCKVCLKQYCSGSMLIKHYKIVHTVSSNDVISCNLCVEWFPSKSALTEHMQFHDEIKDPLLLFCRQCNYSIKTKSVLLRKPNFGNQLMKIHMNKHAEAPSSYSCDQCGNEFKGKNTLQKHIKSIHAEFILSFDCDICNSTFKHPKRLQVHILKEHKKEFCFKCSICEKKYVNEEQLRMHNKRHASPKMCCEECGKKYRTKPHLRDHVMMNHSNKEDLPFACPQLNCGRRFISNYRLTTHSIIHTGKKPFSCEICDSVFRRRSHLDKHSKLHTGERPHVCTYCGKGFIQKANLNLHRGKCDIAAKAYNEK